MRLHLPVHVAQQLLLLQQLGVDGWMRFGQLQSVQAGAKPHLQPEWMQK